jgi:hypothetical protein
MAKKPTMKEQQELWHLEKVAAKASRIGLIANRQDLLKSVRRNLSAIQTRLDLQHDSDVWDAKEAKVHHLFIRYSKLAEFLEKRIDNLNNKR